MTVIDVERGSRLEINTTDGPYVDLGMALPDTGWVQVDFKIREQEKNSIVQCFNNANHIYAFGHDPDGSGFAVTYLVFLGEKCMKFWKFQSASTLNDMMRQYFEKRLSKSKTTLQMTHNGFSHDIILLGLDVSVSDADMHIVSLTLSGKCVGHD